MSEIVVAAAVGRTAAVIFDTDDQVPALYAPDAPAALRAFEFFAVNIRNPNTRKAYARAAYNEGLEIAPPSVKQRLAALRMLFAWLVGQVMPTNLASSVRGPRLSVKDGRTPVLAAEEASAMLDAIDITTPIDLPDRALIGLMVYQDKQFVRALEA